MFERFTEKAVNAVSEAQRFAKELKSLEIYPEHLLLALVSEAKGVSLKLFRMYNVTFEKMQDEIVNCMTSSIKTVENVPFSIGVKDILKRTLDLASKSGNQNILFEHLFLAVITDRNSNVQSVLEKFNFDLAAAREILTKLVQRKIKRLEHPEAEEEEDSSSSLEALYDGDALSDVLERAVSKLSTAGYEILGTEQILASILESENSNLLNTLEEYGINTKTFEEKLAHVESRQSEYEGKKVIFTPNAFLMMNLALQTAKELGSSVITPEHIILSVLKAKKGLAYEILKSLNVNEEKLSNDIIKPIEKQMSETLLIMKLAKEEARRLGRNIVGTEMFLLGIIGEGASVASEVLSELEVSMRDARFVVESLVGYGNEYFDKEIVFTKRAKRVLERAWKMAKSANKQRIEGVDLLLSILEEPDSLAMKVLENLGVDSIEIKHGIQSIKY
jgi:ATP-dependent Clp protease ATP-binding subunit ClpA